MRDLNLQIVKTMLEQGAAGNIQELRKFVAPEFVCREADSLPYAGTFIGFEGYIEAMTRLAQTWQDLSWDVHQLIADDTNVAIRLTLKGRRGDRRFEMPVCEVWELRDGKVVSATPFYFDTKLLADLYAETQADGNKE